MATSLSGRCPGCGGAMVPVEMKCEGCEVTVRGRFGGNEFAGLSGEDLHFLRIFVQCEGRIREMESALGVSYPTIKGRMAKLKEAVGGATEREGEGASEVLRALERGEIDFEEAKKRLKGEC